MFHQWIGQLLNNPTLMEDLQEESYEKAYLQMLCLY